MPRGAYSIGYGMGSTGLVKASISNGSGPFDLKSDTIDSTIAAGERSLEVNQKTATNIINDRSSQYIYRVFRNLLRKPAKNPGKKYIGFLGTC